MLQQLGRTIYRGAARVLAGTGISELPGLRALNALFVSQLRGNTIEVDGHQFHLDPTDSLALSVMGTFEPEETRLIARRVKPGSVALDIGANIGYFTLLLARCVGPAGRVFAFEPEPGNYKLLTRNAQANGYGNVSCVQAAVDAVAGTAKLYLSGENAVDHRLAPDEQDRNCIEVRAIRLDDYLSFIERVDFIKIDVQGGEYGVIDGMKNLIERSPDVEIMFEYWPFGLSQAGVFPGALLNNLAGLGFQFFAIAEDPELRRPVEVNDLANRCTVESKRFLNVYAMKTGRPRNPMEA